MILVLTIALRRLASFPARPAGANGPAIEYSLDGRLGRDLAVLIAPIGLNWQIRLALAPGLAAREALVSSLGMVYALPATGDDTATALAPLPSQTWSVATECLLRTGFVSGPQCLSTLAILATVKRETGGWAMPALMAGYLFALAYAAAFVTYRVALAFGLG